MQKLHAQHCTVLCAPRRHSQISIMPCLLLVSHLLCHVSGGFVIGGVGDISQACGCLAWPDSAIALLLIALSILHPHAHPHMNMNAVQVLAGISRNLSCDCMQQVHKCKMHAGNSFNTTCFGELAICMSVTQLSSCMKALSLSSSNKRKPLLCADKIIDRSQCRSSRHYTKACHHVLTGIQAGVPLYVHWHASC